MGDPFVLSRELRGSSLAECERAPSSMSAVTYATAQILRAMPRARIGRAIGALADRPWSAPVGRAVVGLYTRIYDVRLDDCAQRDGWSSFDAFFTRRLRAGARPVDPDPGTITSPADGSLVSMGAVDGEGRFVVKGRPYSVAELVGDAQEARRFEGGVGCVVYLSPRDYHRVHAPVGGVIRRIRSMPGDYYPVNAIGLRHVANLFCRNRRVAIEIDAEGGIGKVTVVMVVAMIVGRITTVGFADPDVPLGDHVLEPPVRIARGDEIGVFHLGSTVVAFVEKRAAGRWLLEEGPVRYGQALVRASGDSGEHGRPAGDALHGGTV
jgi:phosphatidylserine decarboxylase